MTNKYRTQSEANMYHITIRGTAKQIIFEDDDDRRFFGKRMRQYFDENGVELYAWCFMSNHVHLLLHAELSIITKTMRSLLVSYAMYFNSRHERTGHLFQNRFDSVPIETEEQLMVAVRYIHRNPSEIPGQLAEQYEWSSYREYLGRPFISSTEFVMQLFESRDAFISFHDSWEPEPEDQQHSFTAHKALSDEEAIVYAKELLDISLITTIASLDKTARNHCLATLKKGGLPVAQIARITGIGRNIVQRAK